MNEEMSRASRAVLDAKALFSDLRVSEFLDPSIQAPKSGVERHHLFPRGYLSQLGIDELREVNQIANYTLVEWPDNIQISDTPPGEYFPRYAQRFDGEDLAEMRYWRALPEGWENMEYREFLEARRKGMAAVMRDAFVELSR